MSYGIGGYGAGGYGVGALGDLTPVYVHLGDPEAPLDVLPDAYTVSIRRAVTVTGATDTIEPGTCTLTLRGAAYSPIAFPDARPGRPLVVAAAGDDVEPLFTGAITKAALAYLDRDQQVAVSLTATDAVPDLAKVPYTTAHGGTLAQRVTPVLEAANVPYAVHDTAPEEIDPGTLPTRETTALGQLRLARDTMHGYLFLDRAGVVQVYSDRSREHLAPAVTFTDGSTIEAPDGALIDYTHLDPTFDTDSLVNALTVVTIADPDDLEQTFTDDDSLATWGAAPDTVAVTDGLPLTHALRYFAIKADPDLIPAALTFTVTAANVDTVAQLDLYAPVRVVRADLLDRVLQITAIEHNITPTRWTVRLGLRARDVLPARWIDVDPTLTWDDVDPTLTWNDALTFNART